MTDVAEKLAAFAKDTGIPVQELRQLCLRVGLGELMKGGLTVRAETPSDLGYIVSDLRALSKREREKVRVREKSQRTAVAAWMKKTFKEVLP